MIKKITGIVKLYPPFEGVSKKSGKDFTIYTIEVSNKLESVKLKTFSEIIISGYSDGDEVIAEYDEVINGIYTNYNLQSIRPRKQEEVAQKLFKQKKKELEIKACEEYKKDADAAKGRLTEEKMEEIAKERVRSLVESADNILTIGGKKYEVTFREIK